MEHKIDWEIERNELWKERARLQRKIKGVYRIAFLLTAAQIQPYNKAAERIKEIEDLVEKGDIEYYGGKTDQSADQESG